MATHRFILSAGHRNTDRGGARGEIHRTYGMTVALKEAIEVRGGQAWIVQEEDTDGDQDFYWGGLQAAARYCVTPLNELHGVFDAYISMHHNGGGSPGFHAIFPDARHGIDRKPNNPLDVRLCRAMRDHVRATDTLDTLAWTADSPGVMSERETGVGARGFRLGEMVGTMGFRVTTARVIPEAGSIDTWEARYITDEHWVRHTYAEALTDALEEVFGAFSEAGKDVVAGTPEEQEPWPYPDPVVIEALDGIEIGKGETAPGVVTDEGTSFTFAHDVVEAIEDIPRLQRAFEGAPETGPIIPEGTQFVVTWLFRAGNDRWYYITPWWTRIPYESVKRIADAPHLWEA